MAEPETVYEPVFAAAEHIVSMYFAGLFNLKNDIRRNH